MNNITPMFANNTALTTIRSGGYGSADFDIAVAPLTYNMPYPDDNIDYPSSKSVIYRKDTGQELGVHGHGYKPVAPKHMIDVTRNIIERSDLAINGIQSTQGLWTLSRVVELSLSLCSSFTKSVTCGNSGKALLAPMQMRLSFSLRLLMQHLLRRYKLCVLQLKKFLIFYRDVTLI
jgi:hypothetical protein